MTTLVAAAGLPETWWACPVCLGDGIHPDDIDDANRWTATHPPADEGYQLWETTVDGSLITPVFATLDELCDYASEHCTVIGSDKASATQWRQLLDETDGSVVPVMTPKPFMKVRIRDPHHYTPTGELVVDPTALYDWIQVPFLSVSECEHAETVCSHCIDSWAADWEIYQPDEQGGTNHG